MNIIASFLPAPRLFSFPISCCIINLFKTLLQWYLSLSFHFQCLLQIHLKYQANVAIMHFKTSYEHEMRNRTEAFC